VIADDISFTSPYDDHIDRKTYFERCWPNSERMRSFREVKLFERDGEVFILYEARFDGTSEAFRNTEFIRVSNGKIREVEVYFGSPTKK
jgi:hypothetical protein